jgi:cyanate permease
MDILGIWAITVLLLMLNTVFLINKKRDIAFIVIHLLVMLFSLAFGATIMFSYEPLLAIFVMIYGVGSFMGNVLMVEI